jgi:hypothetical protein
MDYGERQERAVHLVKILRESPNQANTYKDTITGKEYTPAEIADEIENETDIGREILAVSGLVFTALGNKQLEREKGLEKD